MSDLVKIVEGCLRIDFGELMLVLFLFLFEISTGTGLIMTFDFDLNFVGLLSPTVNSLELFTISLGYFPGALTFSLIVLSRFLIPCYFLILSLSFSLSNF